ncbi:hypothetical protein ACFC3R_03145 [Enterococcus durans]
MGAEATPSEISRDSQKFEKAIFVHFFLFLGVKHFCPSLSQINGVQKSGSSEISKKRAIQKAYCSFFSPISQT